jgi:alkyl sulfatase BDS1-like metallo-beta-lactamase superfamily hydrolase
MITGQIEGVKVLLSKDSKVKGNPLKIGKFFTMFKRPDSIFPIVTRPNG